MKKLIYCALALAAGLFAASCQQENLEPVQGGNTVTFTVEIPEVATKATVVDDGRNINNLVYAVYRTDENDLAAAAASIDPKKLVYRINPNAQGEVTAFTADGKTNVTLELINNQKYIVLFWAQVDETWVEGTNFDLTTIAYPRDSELTANQNKYEAFCGAAFVDEVTGATKKSVTLTRPFAQINLASTDPANYDVDIVSSSVKIENAYSQFNVATKKAFGTFRTVEYKVNENPDGKFGDYDHYVAMNYIFANPKNDGTTPIKVTCTINTEDHGLGIKKEINNVPVAQNYRTNIVGNLLTSDVDYEVDLVEGWYTPATTVEVKAVSTAQELIEVFAELENNAEGESTNIKLEGDITLSALTAKAAAPTYGLKIPAGKSLVLDLNGNTLAQTVCQEGAYSMIQNNGTFTIADSKGDGKIAYGDTGNGGNYVSNTIGNSGKLVIESGLIENNSSANVAANGYPHPIDNSGELIINGGTLTNKANYSSMRIWCTTDDDTSVTINGGTFNGSIDFQTVSGDPNKGVLTINAGTFNPDTYTKSSVRLLGFGADVDEMFGYIKGGTFNGSVKINKYGAVQELNSQVFYISGGIFSDDPTEFLATGYATEKDAEGKWIIRECPVKIGDAAYYTTLAEAVAAVKEGETITILAGKTLEEGTIKLPAALKDVTFMGEEGAILKDMTIMAHDGSSISYEGLTFDGITFENSRLSFTGWRTGGAILSNLTVTNCVFENLYDTTNNAPLHINMDANEAVNGLTFTNNVIDGATGGSKSGIYAQVTGEVLVSGNIINNVSFRPYVIQVTTDDNVADNFVVTNNTFSGSAVGRAQGLGNNAEGTDAVNIVVTENIFKGITGSQQICYWNFNPETTTADLSHNYYDIDILANPGKIYYNSAAANVYDLLDMGVFPIYTDAAKTTLYTPEVNSAKIGETEYSTLEEAVAAAKAGDTITVLCNVTLSSELALPAGIIFNGNGKQINGTIYAGAEGNLTFAGHTKVTSFSASYYNRTITIGEGACLEVTGGGRVSLAYGNTFNITGSIENAKTADKTKIQPSLIIPAGISITGGNGAAMNVTNASVQIGSTTSKPGVANGEFTLNFENSIVEFTKELGFYEPTGGVKPTFNMNIKDCVFTTGTKLFLTNGSEVTVDNSTVALGTYIRNSGELNLTNGSTLTGETIQFGENGGNDGTITVDNSNLEIIAGSKGYAFDGKGVGSIKLVNGATAKIDYLKDMILDVAEGCTLYCDEDKQINCRRPVADGLTKHNKKDEYYVSSAAGLEKMHEMFANETAGKEVVLNLIDNIDFTGKTWTPVDSHADKKFTIKEINGNGHTISNLTINGQAMFTRFAGTGDVVVKNITFDNATVNSTSINTSIITGHTYQNVLLDNVDVKNSTIIGGYKVAPLIGTVYNENPSTTVTATLKNCDVENVTVKATSYDFCTTGMVSFVYADDNDKIEFENCTVSNVKMYGPTGYNAHAAIYTTGSETLFNEAAGVTVTNVTFENI